MNLDDDITHLKGVGEKRSELFEKLGINTIEDLLHHFPREYVDFTSPVPIAELNPDETSVFSGYVSKKIKPYFGPKYSIFKLIVSDENADILITIYNSQFTFDKLILGKEYIFYGKISGTILAPECQSPVFIDATEKNLLSPKYNLTKGLSAAIISKCIKNALDSCNTEDLLPEKIKKEFNLIDYHDALNKIHFPNCIDELKDSRRRLAFEELLVLQLGLKLN